ncbi:MAG: tubulin-like doman-containing protein [Lachnospiraceae bacterium]|nr:tubulin-like doman-containing protein [Lachnospiraceae bacterium]
MQMNETPTLIVGLGGIGCSIADQINDMLDEQSKKYVGIIGLDTNIDDLKELSIKTIQTSDERKVKNFIAAYPHHKKWFPLNRFTANRGLLNGAGQIRSISRLAALVSNQELRLLPLEDEIKRITVNDGRDNSNFNVFFVGSITGGTGAGLFLQMPFFIRDFMKRNSANQNVRIRGMFISADITRSIQPSVINMDATMVNAYACIKELNAFYLTQIRKDDENNLSLEFYKKADTKTMARNVADNIREGYIKNVLDTNLDENGDYEDYDPEADEADIEAIVSDGSNIPYDAFYLIEGTDNEGGIGKADLNIVKRQVARIIYTILFTPIRRADNSILDNTVLQDMEGGGMNRYSSAGMCCLKYPFEQVQEYVTMRWVKDIVQDEWLLTDVMYEDELKEALSKQREDGSVVPPTRAEAFVRIFTEQACGLKEDSKLGMLKKEAFMDDEENLGNPISRAVSWKNKIDEEIKRKINSEEVQSVIAQCNVENLSEYDADNMADMVDEVYANIEKLEKDIKNAYISSRFSIANEVFPAREESMKLQIRSELGIYHNLATKHPVAARFLIYDMIQMMEEEMDGLEMSFQGTADRLHEFKDINYNLDKNAETDPMDAASAIRKYGKRKILFINTGKKQIENVLADLADAVEEQIRMNLEYGENLLKYQTYKLLIKRFTALSNYYYEFFARVERHVDSNNSRIELLEKSFEEEIFGEINVYSSKEAFVKMYEEFKLKAQVQLPENTKKAVFFDVYRITCEIMEDESNPNMSEQAKQRRDETNFRRMDQSFQKAVIETLRTEALKKGRECIDLSIRDAIRKEFELATGMRSEKDENYESGRLAYERRLLERGLRMAAPMFSVNSIGNTTETVYLALNPDSAETRADIPDVGETMKKLALDRTPATDNMALNILMNEAFSRYEMICFKSKHKYKVEDLTKYAADSEFAKAYETRIANLGAVPSVEGDDAYKTVVTPHLNRYWHEEGFIPPLGARELRKSNEALLKEFIYGMALNSFIICDGSMVNNDDRDIWYYVDGIQRKPLRKCGRLVDATYADLFDALSFNGKIKREILKKVKKEVRRAKFHHNAEEIKKQITVTDFVKRLVGEPVEELREDLRAREGRENGNILTIIRSMNPYMDEDKWLKLMDGLQLALFEYLGLFYDDLPKLINESYTQILDVIFENSELAVKENLDEADTLLSRKFREIRKQKYRGITSILG